MSVVVRKGSVLRAHKPIRAIPMVVQREILLSHEASARRKIYALITTTFCVVCFAGSAAAGAITSAVKSAARAASEAAGKAADTAAASASKAAPGGATVDAVSGLGKELPLPHKNSIEKPSIGEAFPSIEPSTLSPLPGTVVPIKNAITQCASAAREKNPSFTSEIALRRCNEHLKQCLERKRDNQQDSYAICLAELREFHANNSLMSPRAKQVK